MSKTCGNGFCFPEETGCNIGHSNVGKCPHFTKASALTPDASNDQNYSMIPWTGNSLGLHDLNFLSARNKLTVIGIIGAASSGKTTFLAALYCLLRNGNQIGDYSFAGSQTLLGWENIGWYLSWKPEVGIQFPPHTSYNSGRVPGLLHLSLREKNGAFHDIVFTDAPGEWFSNWAINKDDSSAEGAKWTYKRANGFLLFADSELLSGAEKGNARFKIRQIIERLKDNLAQRPLGLVWSKSDCKVPDEMKNSISGHITNTKVDRFETFDVSVQEGKAIWRKNILESVNWILTKEDQINELPDALVISNDKFFSR